MKRNTLQKTLIIEALHSLDHPCAEDIFLHISKQHPTLSKATVYRNLTTLSEEGEILQIQMPVGANHFDHTCTPHYHFQCKRCQEVFDMEMPYQPDLNDLTSANGFQIEAHSLLFTGTCPHCHNT